MAGYSEVAPGLVHSTFAILKKKKSAVGHGLWDTICPLSFCVLRLIAFPKEKYFRKSWTIVDGILLPKFIQAFL